MLFLANVAKNLKRLRTERGLTQDRLAEEIHVTRQTISGWENGRTQPSVEMLELLSGALGAEFEELIYGKKRNVGTAEDAAPQKRRTLAIVLTVMGSLLAAVGVILLFVWFWQDMGKYLRLALSFLPLLAGGAAGLYAVFSKKRSVRLREGAAVLWTAGMLATVALVNEVTDLDFGFMPLLLLDLLLTLPLMFLLPSVFSYLASLGMISVAVVEEFGDMFYFESPLYTALSFAAIAAAAVACVVLIFKNRFSDGARRFIAAVGLIVLPANVIFLQATLLGIELAYDALAGLYAQIPVYFLCIFLLGRTRRYGLDLRRFSLFGMAAALYCFAFYCAVDGYSAPADWLVWVLYLLPCAASLCACFIYGYNELRRDRLNVVTAAVMAAAGILLFCLRPDGFLRDEDAVVPLVLLSLGFGVFLVCLGVLRAQLLTANFGLLNVIAVLLLILWELAEDNLLVLGGVFLGAGALLLIANRVMIKRFAAKKTAAQAAETEGGEPDA